MYDSERRHLTTEQLSRIRTLIVLWSIMFLPIACSSWNEPTDFRGIPWDTSPELLKKTFPNAHEIYQDGRENSYLLDDKVGHVPVTIKFTYLDDKFVYVLISFKSKHFDTLATAFEQKYGKPHKVIENVNKTRAGVEYLDKSLSWSSDTILIVLERYVYNVDDGVAWIARKEYIEYQKEKRKKKSKEAAKGL